MNLKETLEEFREKIGLWDADLNRKAPISSRMFVKIEELI